MKCAALLIAVALLTGCETFEDSFYKRHQLITIHELIPRVSPRMGKFERAIMVDGQRLYVRRLPMLASPGIASAEALESRDGTFHLALHLDRHGENLWTQAAIDYHGRRLVFMVDGIYRGTFVARSYPGSGSILVPIRLQADDAMLIAEAAEKNYKTFGRNQ